MPYQRVRQLGCGHFGEVWLEHDLALDRLCAAKYLDPARLAGGSFDEAKAMLDAEHENVVRVYAADLEQPVVAGGSPVPVIRMEYLPNGSLQERYGGEPGPVADVVRAIEDSARGVEALHSRGVLHRDIKPGNLLIADDRRIKVSDFGLACHSGAGGNAPPWGYLPHLPPEAVAVAVGIDTAVGDVYAIGVTAYRLLNGDAMLHSALPPGGDLRDRIVQGKYPDPNRWQPHVHDGLRRVVRKAMHPDSAKRYASASELRHAFEQVRPAVSWVPVGGETTSAWQGADPTSGRIWTAVATSNARGGWDFALQRQALGGKLRSVRSDGRTGLNEVTVLRQAARVMQRVAATGR